MKEFSGVKFCLIVLVLFFFLSGCGSKDRGFDEAIQEGVSLEATIRKQIEEVTSQTADIEAMGISREIDVYIKNFTGLYTSNASDDTASAMVIEEQDFPSDTDHGASLTIYLNLSGKRLRYRLTCYGETGNQVINYYLCEGFVWISRQSNFYSSWILSAGYSDILYSETDNWIIVGETVYIMHDNGELEETFTSCRVLGRSTEAVDESADLIGINADNQYLIIYDLSESYFWEQMICIDDMTAVLVKGNNLFRIERISDPMEDRIYNEIG